MIDPMNDLSADLVAMKSAQVGFTVMTALKTFWLAKYMEMYIGYILPTHNVVDDFVNPKVNPLIEKNPAISSIMGKVDSRRQKKIGDRFIFYRGAFSIREAISITLDALIVDELDQCPDMTILNTYDSRLQASKYSWRWRFSNPSIPAFGVHELYQNSDQKHWFVECGSCGHEWYIMYDKDKFAKTHYVDEERGIYACGKCHEEISDDDRRFGRWVAKYPKRARSGYWMSQMIAPYVPAKRIIAQRKESTIEFFYNFVLGLPYQASELLINREAIIKCLMPGSANTVECFMGVDNGIEKHWVLGNRDGIFAYGKTEDWQEVEMLMRAYNATTVIDANPYPNIPKKLAKKYLNKVYIHYYKHDTKGIEVSIRDEGKNYGVIQSDRTKLLDSIAGDVANQTLGFYMSQQKMEEYIYHCENVYRIVEEDNRGIKRGKWKTKENRPDHWLHATAYYKVAKAEALTSIDSGGVSKPKPIPDSKLGVTVHQQGDSFRVKSEEIVSIEKALDAANRKTGRRI